MVTVAHRMRLPRPRHQNASVNKLLRSHRIPIHSNYFRKSDRAIDEKILGVTEDENGRSIEGARVWVLGCTLND